jgi:hypothetical protein
MPVSNILNHAANRHDNCPTSICKFIAHGQLSPEAQEWLMNAMIKLSKSAEYVAEYLNSNLAESMVAILNLMLNGRRTNCQVLTLNKNLLLFSLKYMTLH